MAANPALIDIKLTVKSIKLIKIYFKTFFVFWFLVSLIKLDFNDLKLH